MSLFGCRVSLFGRKGSLFGRKGSLYDFARGTFLPAKGSFLAAKGYLFGCNGHFLAAKGPFLAASGRFLAAEGPLLCWCYFGCKGSLFGCKGPFFGCKGGLINAEYAVKHTGRSSCPCLLPLPRLLLFFGRWAGEPIWNLQENTQVGAPTPTAYPYLLPLPHLFLAVGYSMLNLQESTQVGAPIPTSLFFLADGWVNQFGICRKTQVVAPTLFFMADWRVKSPFSQRGGSIFPKLGPEVEHTTFSLVAQMNQNFAMSSTICKLVFAGFFGRFW